MYHRPSLMWWKPGQGMRQAHGNRECCAASCRTELTLEIPIVPSPKHLGLGFNREVPAVDSLVAIPADPGG